MPIPGPNYCVCVTKQYIPKQSTHKDHRVEGPPPSEALILKGHTVGENGFNSVVTLSWPLYNKPSPDYFTIATGG